MENNASVLPLADLFASMAQHFATLEARTAQLETLSQDTTQARNNPGDSSLMDLQNVDYLHQAMRDLRHLCAGLQDVSGTQMLSLETLRDIAADLAMDDSKNLLKPAGSPKVLATPDQSGEVLIF